MRSAGRLGYACAAGLLLAIAAPVLGKKPAVAPCGGGVFTIAKGKAAPATIVLTTTQITLADACATAVPVRIATRRKVTTITATWPSCTGFTGPVSLKAKMRAPSCGRLTGVLKTKQSRPRVRKVRADRVPAAGLIGTLRDVSTLVRMINENFPVQIRPAAETYNPEVVGLIAMGSTVVDQILEEFRKPVSIHDETALCLLAYTLERIGDARAVPTLTDWLQENLFAEVLWATDFVTHTIKVLDGQGGLNTDTFLYGVDAKLDTITQARAGHAAAAAARAPLAPAAVTPGAPLYLGVCQQTIVVTGINGAGQQETVRLDYRVPRRDYQDLIAAELDPNKQAALERDRQEWLDADERAYGGTDYVPVPGPERLLSAECGGKVTEHLLNAVATKNGLAITLPAGRVSADAIRDLALHFGAASSLGQLDPFTVIAHEQGGTARHVEIPVSADANSALVYSKDEFGRLRQHTVSKSALSLNSFGPPQRHYDGRPWYLPGDITTRFYRLDPTRITSILLDSSACPCDEGDPARIPTAITDPAESMTDQRVITVAGTVGDPQVTSGTLRVNGAPQGVTVASGAFSSMVVLRSGDNKLRLVVDALDGRRGCTERTITSNTAKVTISATLTWDLDDADVDLYVTQPDGETAWYSSKTTTVGGRLDVDNVKGRGPENYFLSSQAGNQVLEGKYTIRVHYYSDHQSTADTPTRVVSFGVVVLLNEGTPQEKSITYPGLLLTSANSGNSSPGGQGSDWATVVVLTIENGEVHP